MEHGICFSYSFRDIENTADITWLYGKGLCICIGLILLLALPKIVRKKGKFMSIHIEDLTVRFKNSVTAIDHADLDIPNGIFGLFREKMERERQL